MAKPNSYTGNKLMVQIGNGATPEVFAHDCMINTERGASYDTQSNEFYEPDCANPDAPASREIIITGTSVTISGAGTMNAASWATFFDWWKTGVSKNVRVWEDVLAAEGGGSEEGAYKLTALERSGGDKDKVTVSLTLESDGDVVRTAHT